MLEIEEMIRTYFEQAHETEMNLHIELGSKEE